MGARGADVIIALFLITSFLMVFLCVVLPYWEQNHFDAVGDDIIRHQGLWLICTTFTAGNWQCHDFNHFFVRLPSHVQAARGLGLIAAVVSLASIIPMFIGCSFNNMESFDKRRLKMVAGVCSVVAGISIVIAVSIYAHRLLTIHHWATSTEHFNYNSGGRFGCCLFVGWAAGTAHLITGIILVCFDCPSDEDQTYSRIYTYKPNTFINRANKEYV